MRKAVIIISAILAVAALTNCKNKNKTATDEAVACDAKATTCCENAVSVPEANGVPAYVVLNKAQVCLDDFKKDGDWIEIFDGKTFKGWRGYDKDVVPGRWIIEDGAIKFNGSGGGEAQDNSGGDLMFAHKFKNFELTFEWKVAKGSNSGVFFLAQEIKGEPIYVSSPEYQILDNANHPDATQGENGNRKSASLYDMIPANPQNSKPFGEWNAASITVYKGSVFHGQNGKTVVEYHLWTKQWTELLQNSKFSQDKWPLAFELLNNLGGANREGYIGLQDHGDDVWYRNIRIKLMD
ncbi:glycosyl hydrolase [Bacteroidia bacterium]|nr:glycosyl hydrolase [Bacteroidia bacterium]